MKKILFLFVVMLGTLGAYAQSNTTPIKGDVNEDGVVDVADIVAIIEIMMNGGGENGAKDGYYYWYVGQTDPNNINSIGTLATDYNSGGGWYELGTSVPGSINQLVKGFDSSQDIYVAVPVTTGTTLKPVASDMTTIDTSVIELTTKVFDNVTYKFYSYGSGSARKTIMFAKK